jgi:hypothetical protein
MSGRALSTAPVLVGLMADKAVFSPWERFLHPRWVPE